MHSKSAGGWETITFKELHDRIRRFSNGLRSLGINHGDRVAILSENRPDWAIADLGALATGAITVPIYPTLPPSQVEHILNDSGSVAIIVSDSMQLQKVQSVIAGCPNLKNTIVMDAQTGDDSSLHSFEAIFALGDALSDGDEYERRRDAVQPSDVASLVYTSGTTGDPKGAMLTHSNFAAAISGALECLPIRPAGERFLSFLPLCHVYERVTYYIAITSGCETYYAESIFKVQDNIATTKPSLVQTVPRLLEVIHEKSLDAVAKMPEDRQKAFRSAINVGHEVAVLRNEGQVSRPDSRSQAHGRRTSWKVVANPVRSSGDGCATSCRVGRR